MQISLFDSPQVVADGVANASRAREAGLHRYWSPQVMNADTMMTLAAVAAAVPEPDALLALIGLGGIFATGRRRS